VQDYFCINENRLFASEHDFRYWHEAAVSRALGLFRSRMKSGHAADIIERPPLTRSGRRSSEQSTHRITEWELTIIIAADVIPIATDDTGGAAS
jgi:hypothetical protein